VIDADGKHERRLTDPKMFAGDTDWSPDGKMSIFSKASAPFGLV
jgi:hypothetical protein